LRCNEADDGISLADVLVSAALIHGRGYRSGERRRAWNEYPNDSWGGINDPGVLSKKRYR
jgi:hypothetical protein